MVLGDVTLSRQLLEGSSGTRVFVGCEWPAVSRVARAKVEAEPQPRVRGQPLSAPVGRPA